MINILSKELISESEDIVNEDIATVTNDGAWVLDGSSGLTKGKISGQLSDGFWFVQQWNTYLANSINNLNISLKQMIKEGIPIIKKRYFNKLSTINVDSSDFPSCAIALVRFLPNSLEYLILGDCTIIIDYKKRIQFFTDDRVSKFDKIAINNIHDLVLKHNLNIDKARKNTLPILRKHRSLKNKQNSYWILEFDKKAIDHAIHGYIEIKEKTDLLIISDGFSQTYDAFDIAKDPSDLLSLVKNKGLKTIYKELLDLSFFDANCIKYPRLKKIDDTSGIFLSLDVINQ